MRYVRYQKGLDQPKFGWILNDLVGELEGTPFGDYRRKEAETSLSSVRLLAPVLPGKIIGVEVNFQNPGLESAGGFPEIPSIYLKPPSSVIGTRQTIFLPPQSQLVEHEIHLAVVIGRSGRWIAPDRVNDYIFGYTIATDITARDLQDTDRSSGRARAFDTFLPLGPWIETDLDIIDILMTCRVKNELRQMASTREMIFSIPQVVAFISSIMTLNTGDIILAGSPSGAGPLIPGDLVQSTIEGIGDLFNPVVREKAR
ncbi:MAG TPA: fumarylacetoacetate hydrolase family protein [Anaerolineaceae bacterium]|jgi:2-keto-4-pentenoate hydratase/2-oxohepta-3-ene-1,7-dioic acid hydratase in catechol pathway